MTSAVADDQPTLDCIWEWYLDCSEASERLRDQVLGAAVTAVPPPSSAKWLAMTPEQVRDHFVRHQEQTDTAASLCLLVHAERLLRADSLDRARNGKRRHRINKQFRRLYQRAGNRFVGLKGEILAVWSDNDSPPIFSTMHALFRHRDWLAHGQFAESRPARTFDSPLQVFLEVEKLQAELERLRLTQPP